jgi:hypothetical protein
MLDGGPSKEYPDTSKPKGRLHFERDTQATVYDPNG